MTPDQIAQQIASAFVDVHPLLRVHAETQQDVVRLTVTHLDDAGRMVKATSQTLTSFPPPVETAPLDRLLSASRQCLQARLVAPRSRKPFAIEPHEDLLPSEVILTSLLHHPSPNDALSEPRFLVTLSRHYVQPWLKGETPRSDLEWKQLYAMTFEGRLLLGLDRAFEAIAALAPLPHLQGFCRRLLDDWIAEEARLVSTFGAHAITDELRLVEMAARSFRETWDDTQRQSAADKCAQLTRFRGSWVPSPPKLVGREVAPPEPDPEPEPLPAFLQRLHAWLQDHRPDYLAAMNPGVPAKRLETLEDELGFALHPDLRAWWSFRDGANTSQAFHQSCELASSHDALRTSTAALACKRTNIEPVRWIQLTVGDLDDVLFVDHVGAFGGTPGQIVGIDLFARSLTIEAPSLSAWVTGLLAMYEATEWILDRNSWFQDLSGLEATPIEHARTAYDAAVPGYPKQHPIEVRERERPKRKPMPLPEGPAELLAQVRELLAAKQKIKAIKIWRDATGDGVKEAKAAVDAIESQ